jgi:hypothetical protein
LAAEVAILGGSVYRDKRKDVFVRRHWWRIDTVTFQAVLFVHFFDYHAVLEDGPSLTLTFSPIRLVELLVRTFFQRGGIAVL